MSVPNHPIMCCTVHVQVSVPVFDHIAPDNIELFVTNSGSHQPSYVYRLLTEFFHPDDYDI